MEILSQNATPTTPEIVFNHVTGVMLIKGRCIPDEPDEFWLPILNWFESYKLNPDHNTTFQIDLEYFNISSYKRILFLLYKLNELAESGNTDFVRAEEHTAELQSPM